jgi:hypothetical protein
MNKTKYSYDPPKLYSLGFPPDTAAYGLAAIFWAFFSVLGSLALRYVYVVYEVESNLLTEGIAFVVPTIVFYYFTNLVFYALYGWFEWLYQARKAWTFMMVDPVFLSSFMNAAETWDDEFVHEFCTNELFRRAQLITADAKLVELFNKFQEVVDIKDVKLTEDEEE